jgi:hypothetical protein
MATAGRSAEDRTSTQLSCCQAQQLTNRLVELIERDRLSVAVAARRTGTPVGIAGMLVRLYAIELECAEIELAERLDDIDAACPGEDWFSYADQQLRLIFAGDAIPNRIIRELVAGWCERTGSSTEQLAKEVGVCAERLRRALGITPMPARVERTHGHVRRRPPRFQKTIGVEPASRIARALGIPPCEVPGL